MYFLKIPTWQLEKRYFEGFQSRKRDSARELERADDVQGDELDGFSLFRLEEVGTGRVRIARGVVGAPLARLVA